MKPEDLNWEFFGFPNPGFLPVWKPAEGLLKALAERELPFAREWNVDAIAEEDQIDRFGTAEGQAWCAAFDRRLENLAKQYLNHLKIQDISALADSSDWSDVMWTWDDLLLEAADGEEEEIADPEKGDLSPDWNLNWLIQRRKAIGLLCYAPVPYRYDYLAGSTHTGVPSSPSESVAAALSGLTDCQGSGLPGTYVTLIYGPDHGWREGSYCCDVSLVRKIYAMLPDGFVADGNVYLILQAADVGGNEESFHGGGKIALGMNILTADSKGVFVEFADDLPAGIKTPTRDHTTSGGWRASRCSAFADFTEIFHFKGWDEQ